MTFLDKVRLGDRWIICHALLVELETCCHECLQKHQDLIGDNDRHLRGEKDLSRFAEYFDSKVELRKHMRLEGLPWDFYQIFYKRLGYLANFRHMVEHRNGLVPKTALVEVVRHVSHMFRDEKSSERVECVFNAIEPCCQGWTDRDFSNTSSCQLHRTKQGIPECSHAFSSAHAFVEEKLLRLR